MRALTRLSLLLSVFCATLALLVPNLPALGLPGGHGVAQERPQPGAVHVATVHQVITGATTSYLRSVLERAVGSGAEVLIVRLDTPGGLLDATRDIVQLILNTPLPVVVYIAPRGARGASAGTMITLASHVAAMAPATHIGAAHPVSLFGGEDNPVMNEKILNDTSAYVESLAQLRGRNAEWAISAVRESKSITAAKALELGVIDLVAENLASLIGQLDGREVRMDQDTTVTLSTVGRPVVDLDMSMSQGFISTLSNPNLVFFLLVLGVLGLYIEFSNPGLILPGVAGAISLLLALIAMQMLPISYGSLALVLLGAALLVAESFVPSFGLLGVGGIAAILFGSLFLLDESQTDLRISRPLIFATVAVLGVVALIIGRLLVKSLGTPPRSFQANLLGASAGVKHAITAGRPGTVQIHGELWRAVALSEAGEIPAGSIVVVREVDGLLLRVEAAGIAAAEAPHSEGEPAEAQDSTALRDEQ